MTAAATRSAAGRYERWVVLAVLALGALRVWVFNAAFPAFNPVDELAHFDLVLAYSHGQWPRVAVQNVQPLTAELRVLYGSPEYRSTPESFPEGDYPPPPGRLADIRTDPLFPQVLDQARQAVNYEAGSAPAYYVAAGLWAAVGRAIGAEGIRLFFWVRFLNVPMFMLLVWLTYRLAVLLFRHNPFLRIGLPLTVASFPQDLFFTISNDTLVAVSFTAVFYLLLALRLRRRSPLYYTLTGLVIAAAVLVKPSNLLLAVVVMLWVGVRGARATGAGRSAWRSLLLLLAAAAIPIALWLLWCQLMFGDWGGVAAKYRYLDWTVKHVGEWFDHPIFTIAGLSGFLAELTRTFWRGELIWHGERMRSPAMDHFYILSTAVCFGAAFLRALRAPGRRGTTDRHIIPLCFLLVGVSVLFLAWLSIRYDFGSCWYPSRQHPYFTSGRLMFGSFIPFAIVYLSGLHSLLFRFRESGAAFVILGCMLVVITAGDIALNVPALRSQYNWFHLP